MRSLFKGKTLLWLAAPALVAGLVATSPAWLPTAPAKARATATKAAAPTPLHVLGLDKASFVTRPDAGPMTALDAIAANDKVPFSKAPILAAQPFMIAAANVRDKGRALDCLTAAVYYEAGFEPIEGQRAVAQVVLNRVRHPAFPKTVCGVVYQGAPNPGCQFTFACDGSMARAPAAWAWRRARAVAQDALSGVVMAGVGEATHYHADYVAPNWQGPLTKIAQVGAHIFYRLTGAGGSPSAFAGAYAGAEPIIDLKARLPDLPPAPIDALETAQGPEEPHAPNDVGGRVELGHGWTPSPPAPPSDAMSRILAGQSQTPPTT